MPHDANGNLLKEGDKVSIQGTIVSITTGEDYCNCTVKVDLPMPPDNVDTMISNINTKQLYLSAVQGAGAPIEGDANAASD